MSAVNRKAMSNLFSLDYTLWINCHCSYHDSHRNKQTNKKFDRYEQYVPLRKLEIPVCSFMLSDNILLSFFLNNGWKVFSKYFQVRHFLSKPHERALATIIIIIAHCFREEFLKNILRSNKVLSLLMNVVIILQLNLP